MKHLRKFNERINSNKLDHDYIKNCFIEFVDKGTEIETEDRNDSYDDDYLNDGIYSIMNIYDEEIEVKSFSQIRNMEGPELDDTTIESFIKQSRELTEFYLDIENAINKVRLKYPDIEYEFNVDVDESQYEIIFYISE